jgi:hypothetical protein
MNAPSKNPNAHLAAPVRFSPGVEQPAAGEAATISGLIKTMRFIAERTFADGARFVRFMPSVTGSSKGISRSTRDFQVNLLRDFLPSPDAIRW